MPLTPGSRLGSYEVLAPLGAGAMGEVWRARDARLSREVALKVLPDSLSKDHERLQRFEREAQVLASLNHPNIAAIYGVEESSGAIALVLEIVDGPTLDERIARGAIPPDEAIAIARQIAEALEYAHEHGVVHRDLKPANVKLATEGRVKVLDFGLAKAIAPDPAGQSSSAISPTITSLGTVAGVILGTAAYMAPEQARGAHIDRRADIWSFGVVLWEMLTGKRLFDDATVSDTLAAVLRAPIEWGELPAATPPGLVGLLKRCLERDPKKRLRDIGEARILLEGGEFERPAETAAPVARTKFPVKSVAWAGAVAAMSIAAIAIVGILKGPTKVADETVLKFNIGAQEKMTGLAWPRLSPDGTMIAFQARGPSGRTAIWVRRLDTFEAQELPGTEGAARHWWSPDSRQLAFFVGNQLKKIAATGGPAQLIAEGESGADGTWGSGGTILFDGRAIDPIYRVDAAGGKFSQATTPDAGKGEAGHAWPFMLPDGKHFLYLAMPGSPDKKAMVMVASLGESGAKTLVPCNSRVEYAAGNLLYVLDGTLVAHRFDLDKLSVEGDPVPIAEHLGSDANGASSFSTSNTGALVYLTGTASDQSDLIWVDRAGKELGRVGEGGAYRDIALAPDGTRLAYGLAETRNQSENIWVRDLRRDVASRLTFGAGSEVWPVWSPDGTRIAYTGDTKTGTLGMFEKDADGTGAERELYSDDKGPAGPTSWSRDGKWIAMVSLPASRRFQLKLFPTQGEPRPVDYLVGDPAYGSGRISPDGKYMAYASTESGNREVYVQTIPPGGGKWQISSDGGGGVQWRADGKEIYYNNAADEFLAVSVEGGARFEPGVPKVLFKRAVCRTTQTSVGMRWVPSADGQRFLINAAREAGGADFSVVLNWPATLERK